MKRGIELRVGILVVVAIVATASWLLFLKEFKFKTATYPIHVTFRSAVGVKQGAAVNILGVDKGKVGEVDLRRDHVSITLEIEQGTDISTDAKIFIQSDIVNPGSIRIEQGTAAETLQPGAILRGQETIGLLAVLEEGRILVNALTLLATRMDSLTAAGRLDRMLDEFESGGRELRLWATDGREDLTRTLGRVDRLTDALQTMVTENREPLGEALDGMTRFSNRADSVTTELGELVTLLSEISRDLEAGEGSLGRLLKDTELHDRVSRTTARVDSLVVEFRKNPRRFVKLSIF